MSTQDQSNAPETPQTPGEPETPEQPGGNLNLKTVALLFAAVGVVIILGVLAIEHSIFVTMQDQFVQWVTSAGPFGWLLLIALLVLHSFVPFPLEFAAVAAGATYGFWLGTLLTWIGTVLGGALSFWLSRRYGRPILERLLNEKQREWIEIHSRNEGWVALLVSRLMPFLSFTLVSYAAGFTRVTWWTFLWTSALGMLPIIVISVLYGANIDNLPVQWVIGIPIVAVIAVFILFRVARKKGWIGKAVH